MTDYPRDPDRSDLTDSAPPVSGEAEIGESERTEQTAMSDEALDRIASATVYDAEGEKVGSVSRVYLRDETGNPSWITVKSGFFGLRESLVPMGDVDLVGDELRVPYSKDVIKGAPHVDADDHLSPAEEEELHTYYRGHGWGAGVPDADGDRHEREGDRLDQNDENVAGVREERAHEEFRAAPPEEHAPRPADRPADLSQTRDDRTGRVEGSDVDPTDVDRDDVDGDDVDRDDVHREDVDRVDVDRDDVDDRDRGRLSGSEALAAGSAGVAGAGVGGADWVDETAPTHSESTTEPNTESETRSHVEADRDLHDSERGHDSESGAYDRNRLGAMASSHGTVDEDEPMDERERVIANDPVSALDDPTRAGERDERFEKMDERTEQLRDTSVTDALLDGNAGVGGIGSEGTDHGRGHTDVAGRDSDSDHDVAGTDHHAAGPVDEVAGVDRDADRDGHEVARADRDADRPEGEVAGVDRSGHDVAGRDREPEEGPGRLAEQDDDLLAAPAGVDPEIGQEASAVPVDTKWRESAIDEVRDGGYGIGSAAPLGEGVQPLGHAVRAWEDTKSFRSGPEAGVEREPDVWFYDENAAYNAGFHPAD